MKMRKIKVLPVFGTRPDAIKMAPLIRALRECEYIDLVVCSTGQHKEMLDQVLEAFGIKPDYDLQVMKPRQSLESVTADILKGFKEVLLAEKPDLTLVHGDTNTCLSCALASFYGKVPCGHVEAGLRSFDKYLPFPEEMNRVLTGRLADLHFAPTRENKNNLLREGIGPEHIYITGNTSIDVVKNSVKPDYQFQDSFLQNYDFSNKRVISVTAHRRENIGQPLVNICNALLDTVERFDDAEVIYAVHMNPAVREIVYPTLRHERIHLIDPLGLWDMHNLMARSYMIVTDSGGMQEEGPALGKPVLVLRNETERQEAVQAGTVKLAGTDREVIASMIAELMEDEKVYDRMARACNPYGDGNASKRIVDAILYEFDILKERPEDYHS
jgi:UDP-N-acetylglucosamine 2-epimerase